MAKTDLSEYLTLASIEENEYDSYKWNHKNTILFLDLYKKYRKEVGSMKLKNLKKMYEEISKALKINNINVSPSNCENRWRVLERAYKKYMDTNKKGKSRRDFEYADVMQEILGKRKIVVPELVLSSNTIHCSEKGEVSILDSIEKLKTGKRPHEPEESTGVKEDKGKKLKIDVLKDVRSDRQDYYQKRLLIEEEKLQVKVKKNKILEEQNRLLQEYLERNAK